MSGVLLRGGLVVDGTGAPGVIADVLVDDATIVAVGPDAPGAARNRTGATEVVDADGLVVCPGFIDMHSHADLQVLLDPSHDARITQGITTEVVGQDGLSYAPVDDSVLPELLARLAGWNGSHPADLITWRGVGEYLDALDEAGTATHVACLVPHGTVRAMVAGWGDVPLTDAQLAAACDLVRRGLREGAVGLSTGLTYSPASYADDRELDALCRVVAEEGGYFAPHTRSYGAGALEAYAEVIGVASRTGCPLHLTHAVMNFAPNRGRAGEFLDLVDAALASGVDITLDSYPYLPGATTLSAILPGWASAGGVRATLERLDDPAALARLRDALEVTGSDGCHGVVAEWDTIEISGVGNPDLTHHVGRTIAAIAATEGRPPFEVCVDLLRRDRLATGILQHVGDEDNVRRIMRHPVHCAGTDGLLVGAKPHPRAWGTMTRYLGHYTRELGVFSLEQCIHHLTGRAAARLRLDRRGLVRPGWAADLAVFDPATVGDAATFDSPRIPSAGMAHVLVDGRFALRDGLRTGVRAGRALRTSAAGVGPWRR